MSIKDEGWTITSSKSNKIRKGQWLYNLLRPDTEFEDKLGKVDDASIIKYKAHVADKLWNMTNEEFDKMMKDWEF